MMQRPKVVWKLILVILIGCGGTFAVIGTSVIKTPPSKYDLRGRWQEFNCSIHDTYLEERKVGISYQLMPTILDRDYAEVPFADGDFPNADYHYYVGPVLSPDPKDSATVFVCSKCIELKDERQAEMARMAKELHTSLEVKTKVLQTCINLRAFQKYYKLPRRKPLVIVSNDMVTPEMKLIKRRRKALILDFQEIHEKGRTSYLEFKKFELRKRNHLDLKLYVSFEYKAANAVVDIELLPKKGKWEIEHYEIKR